MDTGIRVYYMDTGIRVYYGYWYQGLICILLLGFIMDTSIRVYYGY